MSILTVACEGGCGREVTTMVMDVECLEISIVEAGFQLNGVGSAWKHLEEWFSNSPSRSIEDIELFCERCETKVKFFKS